MVRNENILKNVILKMNYDPSKTLNENIEEQSMGGMMTPTFMSDPKNVKEFGDFIYEYRHGLIDIASVGTFFIPVVGPLISLGLELANAEMYRREGDPYTAGLSLAFAMIPFGELVAKVPAVKKLGKNGLKSLIKKSSDNTAKITKLEKEVLEGLNKNKNWITKKVSKEAAELVLRKSLSKISLSQIIKTVYKLGKKNPTKFNLMKLGLQIGGAWYSWDKLAEIYGIKEKTDSRTKSKIVKPEIVTDFDKNWDYKKEGDKYFARKKGTTEWILASGKSEMSIREKVFKVKTDSFVGEDIELQKKLNEEFEKNPNLIIDQVIPGLTSISDEEKNKEVIEAFSWVSDFQ
jgi:hypothetical protein